MNRRLFLGQTVSGLALHLMPSALFAKEQTGGIADSGRTRQAPDKAIQSGLIGQVQQLHITHLYSPEHTSKATLLALAQRDFAWVEHLTGLSLPVDGKLLFTDSPTSTFGSYSARFSRTDITVVWQGLARIGPQASAPTGKVRIYGSEGILQTATNGRTYQLIDLRGRINETGINPALPTA